MSTTLSVLPDGAGSGVAESSAGSAAVVANAGDAAAATNSFNSVPSLVTVETANMAGLSISATTTATSSSSANATGTTSTSTTIVYGIRHGQSVSNVWMTGSNEWGAPTYNDTLNTPDAPLSPKGIAQATALGQKLLLQQQQQAVQQAAVEEDNDWFSNVDLIVVSPLTRCLQTYQYAIHPLLQERRRDKMIPVVVQPLLAERLYSVSETGRPLDVLQREFADTCPELDWSLLQQQRQRHGHGKDGSIPNNGITNGNDDNDSCWWYNPLIATSFNQDDDGRSRPEWRPHGQGQYYGNVVGEPMSVFVKRMDALRRWLHEQQRSEKRFCILTVAHWGVYRHLANVELDNCQVCSFELVQPVAPSSAKMVDQQQQQEINASIIASPSVTLSAL